MSASELTNRATRRSSDVPDWPTLVGRAAAAVAHQAKRLGQLTPTQIADVAIAALPEDVGVWLRRRLAQAGWLDPRARIPFDILDSELCPPDLRDGRRELVRVALFGPPGEGRRSDSKRREAVFQQRCAEIMREARDPDSLAAAASRALGHPEVHGDAVLFGMLRSFIAERQAELNARAHLPEEIEEDESGGTAPRTGAGGFRLPLAERVNNAYAKLRIEFGANVSSYNEEGARNLLTRIRDLRHRYPGVIDQERVSECEAEFEQLVTRRREFAKVLDDLTTQAHNAAASGDQVTASWIIRRFDAIHTLLPAVMPDEKFESLRENILSGSEDHERHEAARELVRREQSLGIHIKKLGTIIHRYELLRQKPSDDPAVNRQAELDYQRAVEAVNSYDDDWLADLMIELDCLLSDLRDPRGRAEAQVDKFVNDVRAMVQQMRRTIAAIQKSRAESTSG